MKRKRYTYIPKDEIAEVRTFNDVSFESDDLLDGAYVKGRKKFARGGMPSKRPISLEEQAAESVGYDIWYSMDAVNQKELVEELVSTGMITPMFANGGAVVEEFGSNNYDQWEMVVISKGLEKDGGQYLKGRYLVSAKDIEEAKKIATELWKKEMWNSDFYIVKVMSDSLYRLKYMDVYADGGVTGSTYSVKYRMKDNPEIVEKMFTDKDSAELFYEIITDDEDLVVMDLQEIKAAPKKSLFAMAKPAPATPASKKKRERVQVDGIADEIARYDVLKATINNAKAEQEVIGGILKEIGREKFLDLYEQRGVRPANFDLADGSENILLEILDKYLKVEPEKAQILRQFDGLLEEKTSYEFDSELLEKEVSEGMTIGDVVSMLIQDSKLIPDGDKANLIKAKMTMRVPKGTIDRLMDYDNPREVFSLISPILALK